MILVNFANFLALGFFPIATAQEKECYAPDGKTTADNETYVACNKLGIESESGVHSSCCNLDGEDRDTCSANGLCLNSDGVFVRGFCTDKTWKSPACVNICTEDAKGGSSDGVIEITQCPEDNTYCCGKGNQSCCGTDNAYELRKDPTVIDDDLVESATVTVQSSSLNGAAYKNATISLAVVLGVGALVGLGILLWLFRKNRSLIQQLEEHKSQPMMRQAQAPSMSYRDSVQPDNTDTATNYTGPSSPHQHWSTSTWKRAASPSVPEADSHQRYSELDATVASDVIQSNSGSPRPQQTPYDEYGFPSASQQDQPGQHPQ